MNMQFLVLAGLGAGVLAGCSPALSPSAGDAPGRQSAYFAEFPTQLFAAAALGCSRQADTLRRADEDTVVCESLVPPEVAASLILQYDGNLEDLPVYINRISATPAGPGYRVTVEYFFSVPQQSGDTTVIRVRQTQIERTVREVFLMAGGQAIAEPS
ncbi:MAG: hypothetical protein AAFO93_09535 [Pseudomonadota bacterium]